MSDVPDDGIWLSTQCDSAALTDPRFRRLFEYWRDRAGARPAPRRMDIDPPIDFPTFLPTTILFDVERNGGAFAFRYRLVGTELVMNTGHELRGRLIDEVFGAERVASDIKIYDRISTEVVCYFGSRTTMVRRRETFQRYRRIIMPVLGNTSGKVDILWAWLAYEQVLDRA